MPVRSIALVACLLIAVPAAAQRQQLDTLNAAQAISRAAAASPKSVRAVFEFKVQSATRSRGGYYLDSERDFHSPANLGVMIRPSAMPELTKKYGDDLKAALVGKTVKIIGQVRRRVVAGGTATATQVEVTHAGQILSVS
jgi:curli biogenesis system outer membrane secretion channel CsgG